MAVALHELVQDNDGIPSLPTIYTRISDTVEDPRSSMRDIAQIISTDQSLSARLLRLVNSAFFGFPSKIDTISHAVTIVGTQQLRDLALATAIIQMFKNIPAELVDMKSFWRHSIGCGIASRLLASYHCEPNIEHFFVAGLLHDVGRLILYGKMAEEAKEILTQAREKHEILHHVERQVLGFDHADVGGLLLQEWKLPATLEEAVKYHHRPTRAPNYMVDSGITHIADLITNALELGTSGESFVPLLDESCWSQLVFSPSILAPMTKQVDQQFHDSVDLFMED